MTLPGAGFFVVHALASVLLSGAALALGRWLQRNGRLSAAAHGHWLGLWALGVVPGLLALALGLGLPASVAPAAGGLLPLPPLGEFADWDIAAGLAGSGQPRAASPAWLGALLGWTYALGFAVAALRWWRGLRAVGRIVQASTAVHAADLPGPQSRAVSRQLQAAGVTLRWSTTPHGPFAVCRPDPRIVLPRALAQRLDDTQLALVLRHEAQHLFRRDPQRAALLRGGGTLFWFNPFLARLAERVQIAAELHCDAAAIAGDASSRRSYARAYLETVRLTAALPPLTAAAFTPEDPGNHKLRITHMLHGDSTPPATPRSRRLLTLSLLAAGIGATVLQAALAGAPAAAAAGATVRDPGGATAPAAAGVSAAAAPAATPAFASPLALRKITSRYGATGKPYSQPHRGLDFAGKRGTPVLAPAAGVVVEATTLYQDSPKYGTVVVLDHGGGWQSLYAHLEGYDVQVGERIAAGAQIGRIGTTGVTTGPHVHVEVLRDGQRVDPEPLLK